jgi:N-acetylmuramoyl-L-alanine amidase
LKRAKPPNRKPARRQAAFGVWAILCKALRMRNTMPCVGLVVLVGSLTFVITPDEEPAKAKRYSGSGKESLPLIVIDPGHGGRDAGACNNGLVEKDLTLDLAQRVDKRLHRVGFDTVLTRKDDTYMSLQNRADIGNQYDNTLFLSLHFNQDRTSTASGVETFYETEKVVPEAAWTWIGFFNKPDPNRFESGETLAGYVQTSLVLRTDAPNRGIKARDLYVVRHVRNPAVLIEGGFLSSPIEARLLSNGEYRERLATAIVEGVMSYVKSRPRPAEPSPLVKLER